MSRSVALILYVAAMIAVIFGLDVTLFRHRLLERLMANVGVVMLLGAFYLQFFWRSWRWEPSRE